MKNLVGKFSFEIPALTEEQVTAGLERPDAGTKVEKPFEYQEAETDEEAQTLAKAKKLSFKSLVNEKIKSNARANAYQAALLPYRPSEVSPEDIKERMVRDYIRLGIPEDVARKQVEGMLANAKQTETANVETASE